MIRQGDDYYNLCILIKRRPPLRHEDTETSHPIIQRKSVWSKAASQKLHFSDSIGMATCPSYKYL